MGFFVVVAVIADQLEEYGREKHKDKGLDQTDEQFEEIKWQSWKESDLLGNQTHHGLQHGFTGENVSEKPERKRHRTEKNGEHFDHANDEEDDDHENLHESRELPFRSENVLEESNKAVLRDRPVEPQGGEDQRQRRRHVQIRISTTKKRQEPLVAISVHCLPTNGSDAGKQTNPVGDQDKDENATEKPKCPLDQVSP